MLDALTPSLVIIISACTTLFFLGLVLSFYTYFLSQLRPRRSVDDSSILPQTIYSPLDLELRQSLYSLPDLLGHYPRGSLAECELPVSSRWSTSILDLSDPPTPTTPNWSLSPLSPASLPPSHSGPKRTRRHHSSINLSLLRQSLYSETSLPMSPSTASLSTVIPENDEGHFPHRRTASGTTSSVGHRSKRGEAGTAVGEERAKKRRNSAPASLVLSRSTILEER